MTQDQGASSQSEDRATRPADQAPAGLGDTASVPCAARFASALAIIAGVLGLSAYATMFAYGPQGGPQIPEWWFDILFYGLMCSAALIFLLICAHIVADVRK